MKKIKESYIWEALRKELSTPINLIACIVTFANSNITIFDDRSNNESVEIFNLNLGLNNIVLGIILLIFLEGCIGNVFGKLIVYIEGKGEGVYRILLLSLATLSAYVSVFNVEWLIYSPLMLKEKEFNSGLPSLTYFLCVVGVAIISVYLINSHGRKARQVENYFDYTGAPTWLQLIAFVIIMIFNEF